MSTMSIITVLAQCYEEGVTNMLLSLRVVLLLLYSVCMHITLTKDRTATESLGRMNNALRIEDALPPRSSPTLVSNSLGSKLFGDEMLTANFGGPPAPPTVTKTESFKGSKLYDEEMLLMTSDGIKDKRFPQKLFVNASWIHTKAA